MDDLGYVDECRPLLASSSRMTHKSVVEPQESGSNDTPKQGLRRALSARQVQMIAIGGTIGKF